jgi:hypothetical protein
VAAALANLGDLARTRGDAGGAEARYREGLLLFARPRAGVCLHGLAWAAWAAGRLVEAARRYGPAEALCPRRAAHEQVRATLWARLGAEAYAPTHRVGGCISLEEAIAEAAPAPALEAARTAVAAEGG